MQRERLPRRPGLAGAGSTAFAYRFWHSSLGGTRRSCLAPALTRPISWLVRTFVVSADSGSALVETAAVLPVVFLIMTGVFSLSIALHQKMQLSEAVSVGGRFLAVDRGDTDPCASTAGKIYAAAPALNKSNMTLTFILNGVSYSNATCSGTTNMISGSTATVTASYPCSVSIYGRNLGSCTLGETVTEVVQ